MKQGLLDYLAKASVALPEETVTVPEWGGREVTLRGFSSRERDLFEEDNIRRSNAKASNGAKPKRGVATTPDLDNFRARLVARSIVEGGMRTCANSRGEEMLGEQPASVLDRLFSVAQRLHGMSDQDIEELSGNSAATAGSEPSSASQESSESPSQNSTAH